MRVPSFDDLQQDLAAKLQSTRQQRQKVCYFPVHDLLTALHLARHYAADNWPVAVCRTPQGGLPVSLYLLPYLYDNPATVSHEFAFPWREKPLWRSPAWLAGVIPLQREDSSGAPPPALQLYDNARTTPATSREQLAEDVLVASSMLEVAIINVQTEISLARREKKCLLITPCGDTVMAIHIAKALATDPKLTLVAITSLDWGRGGERMYVIIEPQGQTFTADFAHGERLLYASPAWREKMRATPESLPQSDAPAERQRPTLVCVT